MLSFLYSSFAQDMGTIAYEFKFPSITRGAITVKALLQFNDSTTLFSYYKLALEDSIPNLNSLLFDSTKGAIIATSQYDEKGAQVYRNFKTNQIIFRQSKVKPLDPYTVNDDWINILWSIEPGKKDILGYTCQKATGDFRGRTYEAWFTTGIPLPYGPWKLFGLPGVILEATDKDRTIHLIAKAVNLTDSISEYIVKPEEKKTKTIKQFVHDEDFYLEEVETAFKQKLPPGITVHLSEKDRTTPQKIKQQRKFSLEKKYEWEKGKEDKLKNNIDINIEHK